MHQLDTPLDTPMTATLTHDQLMALRIPERTTPAAPTPATTKEERR